MIASTSLQLAAAVALVASPLFASAHQMISDPSVWGLSTSLENPLNMKTANPFCHGKKKTTDAQMTLKAGSSKSIPVLCGEAYKDPDNAVSICSDDTDAYHLGGGCALSISYKSDVTDYSDFTMFSMTGDCPNQNKNRINFEIPENLPACDDCTCAWTWIPDPAGAGPEMYMDCFNCKILSEKKGQVTGGISLADHMWAIKPFGMKEGDDEKRPIYKKVLKEGAQDIEVDGTIGGGSGGKPTHTKPSDQPTNKPKPTQSPHDGSGDESPDPKPGHKHGHKHCSEKGIKKRMHRNQ